MKNNNEMDALLIPNLMMTIVLTLGALIIGYLLGSRLSRRESRRLQREMNQQSLDMLDVKSEHAKLSKFLAQAKRKDRLLRHSLKKLKAANDRADMLAERLAKIEKQHFIKTSRLRLLATHSSDKARRATAIAAKAAAQLKRLEKAIPTQTINAPPPKSYGQAASVPVRVVDQHSPDAQTQSVVRVSNRDSVRLTRLRSSNEEKRFNSANLQAIEGVDQTIEQKLNKAGIHRVEQLANMSDSDLAALSAVVAEADNEQDQQNYTAALKGGAQRLLQGS